MEKLGIDNNSLAFIALQAEGLTVVLSGGVGAIG